MDARRALAVATVAVPAVRNEQGATAIFTFLHRTVFVVGKLVLRAHVLGAAFEAEDAAPAIVARHKGRAWDTEK